MSVSLPGSDESLQTTDKPGAQRTHSVYFASLLLSCSVQSVAEVQSGRRMKKKILETNWLRYLAGRAGGFLGAGKMNRIRLPRPLPK